MLRKILIICIDGFGPEYFESSPTPNIDRMAAEGAFVVGQSVIPSVTNVNNVSIITGQPPRIHGVTANYWLDTASGQEDYMESAEWIRCPTILEQAKSQDMSTALLTSKEKLLHLLDAGADYSLSAESPNEEMVGKIGAARHIYSPDINLWLFRAAHVILRERNPDLMYCSTTDGMMHKYAADQEESIKHIQGLDSILGQILDENPEREVYLTADHGMSAKTRGIDLEKVLAAEGIEARAIPIIKDRYVAHHQNLGGASYVYLPTPDLVGQAMAILQGFAGIEAVYQREEAAQRFALMPERIGDVFVLGDKETVFGEFASTTTAVAVRSHGSRHESAVPIIAYRGELNTAYKRNFDIALQLGLD